MKIANSTSFFLLAALLSAPALSQLPPAAPPITADLARYYFASPEAEVAARTDLDSALNILATFKTLPSSGQQLLQTLKA